MADERYDVLVIGAGPAGIAAACAAAAGGRRVAVLDDNPDRGGQIWRGGAPTKQAASWLERFRRAAPAFHAATRAVGRIATDQLLAESEGRGRVFAFEQLILATGACELFLPFPGWTLPQVVGAGGLQALVKTGIPIAGRTVLVAGSGPLLLAVAAYLKAQGAHVPLLAEQTTAAALARFTLGLAAYPGKLAQTLGLMRRLWGTRLLSSCWPTRAEPDGARLRVWLRRGERLSAQTCDYLACGFGLVPNLELATLLGCDTSGGAVRVDEFQRTNVPHVYCAGETTGIGGVDTALLEGQIAGYAAAAGREGKARALFARRARARRFAAALEKAFALRAELKQLADAETLVCRCEDVPLGRLRNYESWPTAKLQTRCGMGPCQGRVCGPAVQFLLGWRAESVRPPIFPTTLDALANSL